MGNLAFSIFGMTELFEGLEAMVHMMHQFL